MKLKDIKLKKVIVLPFLISALPIIAVFFSNKILSLFIIIIIIVALFEKNKFNNLRSNKFFLRPYVVFVVFCILATFISYDFLSSIKVLERYIPLILIPIIIFSSNLDGKRLQFILKSYITLMLLISIFSIGRLIWFIYSFGDWIEVMREVNQNDTYLQFKYPHLMWDVHPSYWSYLIIIVNIILLNSIRFGRLFNIKYTIFILIAFNINLFYLAARIPLFINICIHLGYLTFYLGYRTKYLLATYFLIFSAIIIAYFQMPFLRYKMENIQNDDRFFLWSIAYENAKSKYFLSGEGFGMAKKVIAERLTMLEDPRISYKGTEIHNQYLTILLETGIWGVLTLLYLYISPFFIFLSKKKKTISFPILSISILIVIASIIEPFFRVIKGIVIFAIFSSIFKLTYERIESKHYNENG